MEEFLSIDWNPPLEDMLEGDFVNIDRFRKESAMYKTLRGNFVDPFADLHVDYERSITDEIVSEVKAERQTSKVQGRSPENDQKEELPQEERAYVPGIARTNLKFPKPSELNVEQQALSLRVLLRFSGSEKPSMNASEKEELQTYMSLMPIITKEQEAFLEFARSNWDSSPFAVQEEEFINRQWARKVKLVDSLPRYYTETQNIPFVSSKIIGINYHSICLKMGILPKIILPKLTKRYAMQPNAIKIDERFFTIDTHEKSTNNGGIFKAPVSRDPNCDLLAKNHDVDLVISSGGLNCLALNVDPNIVASWILPIIVKRVNDKNVVFVDKPLPPAGLNVLQKNAWFHKYNVKSHLSHPYHCLAVRLDENSKELSNENEADMENFEKSITSETSEDKKSENCEMKKIDFASPPDGHNVFYRLFSIGSSDETQNELMKNRVERAYKLLVRSKTDGIIKTTTGEEYLTMIAAKIEHQLALGAEAVSVEEALKQWMSLTFRPDTSLVRVRMEAKSMEFIQYEKRTTISINNEIKRLYGLKTEAALTLLYNVAETMTGMNPGRYILRHTPRNGAFACVYKETDGTGKNVFDLQTIYWDKTFPTVSNPPWPPLDKVVVTPALKVFKRMPAMFYPTRKTKHDVVQKGRTKNQRGGRGNRRGRGGGKKKKSAG